MEQIEKQLPKVNRDGIPIPQLAKRKPKKIKKLKKIKYVGVEFDPSKIEYCENQVNDFLSQGYEPIRDIDTSRGLVLVLGLWQ